MSNSDYPVEDGQTDEDIAAEIAAANDGSAPEDAADEDQTEASTQDAPAPEAQEEIASLKEQILRLAAELENTRRRADREKTDAARYAIANFARDLLSVADNFERALVAAPDENAEASQEALSGLVTGLRMTDNELRAVLQRHGVKQISPKGEKFDPNLHQAVAQAPSVVPSGHVADVAQTGFMIGDRVLRAAMVIVSTGGGAPDEPTDGEEPGARVDTQA